MVGRAENSPTVRKKPLAPHLRAEAADGPILAAPPRDLLAGEVMTRVPGQAHGVATGWDDAGEAEVVVPGPGQGGLVLALGRSVQGLQDRPPPAVRVPGAVASQLRL